MFTSLLSILKISFILTNVLLKYFRSGSRKLL